MSAIDNACLLELSKLIEDGLTPEQAIRSAIERNQKMAEICSKMGKYDLASVASNRVAWYRQRRKTD